jgi:hypothetical protein
MGIGDGVVGVPKPSCKQGVGSDTVRRGKQYRLLSAGRRKAHFCLRVSHPSRRVASKYRVIEDRRCFETGNAARELGLALGNMFRNWEMHSFT